MSKVFSGRTLGQFEDAAASIPLRRLDRAFQNVDIRLGADPGGSEGVRRTQFRRYIASVDQHDPQHLERLGAALGALIEEVATSKIEFLVKGAERDGFLFEDGVFRPAATNPDAFAVTGIDDLARIDERGARLRALTNESPRDAVGGARELVESVCRTVLRLLGEPAPRKAADIVDVVRSTLNVIDRVATGPADKKKGNELVHRWLLQLGAVVASSGELRNVEPAGVGRGGATKRLSSRHARLAVSAAVAFAAFVAESYADEAASKSG